MLIFKICLHLFTSIAVCSCLVKNFTFQANTLCDENIELSLDGEPETTAESAIVCAVLCTEKAGCGGFLYFKGTKKCHGVDADSPMLAACALPGAQFYKNEPGEFESIS